ncbi:unnamed protein product [Darwinula stevensoni]|uniref:Endonuclease/exonuclease/phosphatase domain-containing protein n=1 Tax=Darwinula stevensoni TaxID=69355 RepID=A0A7R8XCG0_9CRUS|nr:unnamed protein product [Darwinula stevensoni]CAG0888808.1 unnamed protein product [Darwinula stevensoni]
MKASRYTICAFFLCLAGFEAGQSKVSEDGSGPLNIASFNIQRLGKSKLKKSNVVDVIVQILSNYDVVAVQELLDDNGEILNPLVERLNRVSPEPYEAVASDRIGSTSYKEKYLFLYRPSRVELLEESLYPDQAGEFERPPYVVTFRTPTTELKKLSFINVHTKPERADSEISALATVSDWALSKTKVQDQIILGDFNGGCSYVTGKEWEAIELRRRKEFRWLIPDHADTTTKDTVCPYDRFVARGEKLWNEVVEGSVGIRRFDTEFGLTEAERDDISDHYPIHMKLKPSAGREKKGEEYYVEAGVEARVQSSSITKLVKAASFSPAGFQIGVYHLDKAPSPALVEDNGREPVL